MTGYDVSVAKALLQGLLSGQFSQSTVRGWTVTSSRSGSRRAPAAMATACLPSPPENPRMSSTRTGVK